MGELIDALAQGGPIFVFFLAGFVVLMAAIVVVEVFRTLERMLTAPQRARIADSNRWKAEAEARAAREKTERVRLEVKRANAGAPEDAPEMAVDGEITVARFHPNLQKG